ETAVLAVPINGRPMVVASMDNIYAPICISVKPGNRPVPHCSALGRLTLAFSSDKIQSEILKSALSAETEHSMVSETQIRERIEVIRRQYYEGCSNEVLLGVNTVAVPIFRDGHVLAGALAVISSVQNVPNPPRP